MTGVQTCALPISAYDAEELKIDPKIAGTKSHVAAWMRYQSQRVLILEDDALFCKDFNEKFDEYMQQLPKDWDIFYLGALLPKFTGEVKNIGNPYWFEQVFSTGSHAYCIKPTLMYSFAQDLENYDWYIDIGLRLKNEDHKCYIAQPNLVTQFPSFSDLRGKEVDDF